MSDNRSLPSLDEVDAAAIDSFRLGSGRNQDLLVLSPPPMLVRPFPVLAPTAPEVLAPLQRTEIPLGRIANEHDVSPVPTVPTIGPTSRHVSLPSKADAPVATGSAFDPDLRLVVHQLFEV
jgi:hypothetical protein